MLESDQPDSIAAGIQRVHTTIGDACARAGRDPASVVVVAVSKRKSAAQVLEAVQAGLRHFGENRVEEAYNKIPEVRAMSPVPLTWHMVGHVQGRKALDVFPLFSVVQSVDSVKLAERLSRISQERMTSLDVLLQVNVSGEESKSGFEAFDWDNRPASRQALLEEMRQILALPGLRVRGLMTMAPIFEDMEMTRPVFAAMARLRDALQDSLDVALPELSMGMTDDYPVAIEEGATIVRIGRAIFGERN